MFGHPPKRYNTIWELEMAKYPWDRLLDGEPHRIPADQVDNFESFRVCAYEAAKRRAMKASVYVLPDGDYALLAVDEGVDIDTYIAERAAEEREGASA